MNKVNSRDMDIVKLLSLVTAESKVEPVLEEYLRSPNKDLYVKQSNNVIKGCVGVDNSEEELLVICHIAVKKIYQGQGNASEMINFVNEIYKPSRIIAETDSEAVGFYQKYGFEINSLGEKYPNVERFRCIFMNNHVVKNHQQGNKNHFC
ncbi:hypothetical protein BCR21_11180 [Enterococcus ureasiticus]|uniref:N-acetyltransferase domain-containing protein n=1 Tax=Enterococcus ureasiticus TaxID=903984 RepID=A0A1E5GEB9_9ENTE|nr:hypothetical protein BCR21_11180 [Enterococcus ureasiticus]